MQDKTKDASPLKNGGKNALLIALISAIVGGAGGPLLLVKFAPTSLRPDPFTGSDAKVLENRIASLEYHVRNHPDTAGRFENRIATLEAQNTIIISELRRMNDRLDHMTE